MAVLSAVVIPAFLATMALTIAAWQGASAQGGEDFAVTPPRIVFEGRNEEAKLTFKNTSAVTTTYRALFINMRMSESGELSQIAKPGPGERFAAKYVRYAPHKFTLRPGATQNVRLLLRKTADVVLGEKAEYRSHLIFRPEPKDGAGETVAPAPKYTVPVLFYQGKVGHDLHAETRLTDLAIMPAGEDKRPQLVFRIRRGGELSVFGDLTVTLSENGKESVVGSLKDVAVYAPYESRTVKIGLNLPEGIVLRDGQIKVEYKAAKDATGKGGGALTAAAAIGLP
ncbi:MAG: hypothetical protein RIB59_15485 [Rhodospirillales bacterium]